MNKYDKKIVEVAPDGETIHELIRRPVRSPLFHFIDILLDSVLWSADGFTSKGAYYLVLDKTKAELIHIERNLDVSHKDVTSVVQVSANKNSFKFEGYKYKLIRKIR